MNLTVIVIAAAAAAIVLLVVVSGGRVVHEHERAVVFRLGRLRRISAPGLRWLLPLGIERAVRVDVRINSVEVQTHEAITLDQAMVRVVATLYYQVVNPQLAVSKVSDFREATASLAEAQLRGILGKVTLDDLLSMRAQLGPSVTKVIDDEVEPWGVRIISVELRDVILSEAMQRALARQAEAERERKSKIAAAEGELLAAKALVAAAGMMADRPAALQLRYLQTLSEIGTGRSTVVVFPVPIDLLQSWAEMRTRGREGNGEARLTGSAAGTAQHVAAQPAREPEPPAPQWPDWYRPR
ncbi:MAG: slipin family protein [Candidatus Dormibacteraeota bacterium]|nr:slipin family protein [Candidatus Dormibacteraeota bacterium]MBV8444966.1 slipin family protein [Candidatus Dormibacteraeota bacterium]